MIGLEELGAAAGAPDSLQAVAEHQALARLTDLIRPLILIDQSGWSRLARLAARIVCSFTDFRTKRERQYERL